MKYPARTSKFLSKTLRKVPVPAPDPISDISNAALSSCALSCFFLKPLISIQTVDEFGFVLVLVGLAVSKMTSVSISFCVTKLKMQKADASGSLVVLI